ncbi:unnamed protein product, partial [Mesorhabditis belari]|uniref:C-type lectin domain-containing protein n=1 Tax=Mesorhabditis belari TaxID=2138241 RepID=A0AAF3EQC9_9BILA
MGVMAVGLFITILLLFHQISSSVQQNDQLNQFTSPNDRDEILSRDRRTLKNETEQALVEARGKISGLEREIARQRNETKDKDVEMAGKMAQIETDLMGKIAETKRKNDDLEAQLSDPNTEVRDRKAKIEELERKINALQSKNLDLETKINRTMDLLDLYRDGWSYLAKTASSYKVIDQKMTFDEAEAYCASRKSQLVSIHSQEEHDFVSKLAKNVDSIAYFWIGLKRNPNKGNAFEWTDGSSVDFTNWRSGEPDSNTHAALWGDDGKWDVWSPTDQRPFICGRSSQF